MLCERNEFAKLRASRAFTSYAPLCLRAFAPYVLTRLRALHAFAPYMP